MHAESCAANDWKSARVSSWVKMLGLLAGICLLQVLLARSNMLLAVNLLPYLPTITKLASLPYSMSLIMQ